MLGGPDDISGSVLGVPRHLWCKCPCCVVPAHLPAHRSGGRTPEGLGFHQGHGKSIENLPTWGLDVISELGLRRPKDNRWPGRVTANIRQILLKIYPLPGICD